MAKGCPQPELGGDGLRMVRSLTRPDNRNGAKPPAPPMQPDAAPALTLCLVCALSQLAMGVTTQWSCDGSGFGGRRSMMCRVKMRVPREIRMFVVFCMMLVMRVGLVGKPLHVWHAVSIRWICELRRYL